MDASVHPFTQNVKLSDITSYLTLLDALELWGDFCVSENLSINDDHTIVNDGSQDVSAVLAAQEILRCWGYFTTTFGDRDA